MSRDSQSRAAELRRELELRIGRVEQGQAVEVSDDDALRKFLAEVAAEAQREATSAGQHTTTA